MDENGGPTDVWYGAGNGSFAVVDGVLEYTMSDVQANIWDNGVKQWITIPLARKDENYIFSFKAWPMQTEHSSVKLKIRPTVGQQLVLVVTQELTELHSGQLLR